MPSDNLDYNIDIRLEGQKLKNINIVFLGITQKLGHIPMIKLILLDQDIYKYYEKELTITYSSQTYNFSIPFVTTSTEITKDGVSLTGINSSKENYFSLHTSILGTDVNSILSKVGDKRQIEGIVNYTMNYPCIYETYNRVLIKMLQYISTDKYPVCITLNKIKKLGSGQQKDFLYSNLHSTRLQIPKVDTVKYTEETDGFYSNTSKKGYITYSENRAYIANLDNYYNNTNIWRFKYHTEIDRLDLNYELGDKVKLDEGFMDTKTNFVIEKTWYITTTTNTSKIVLAGY